MPNVKNVYTANGKQCFRAKIYEQDEYTKFIVHEGKICIVKRIGEETILGNTIKTDIYMIVGEAKITTDFNKVPSDGGTFSIFIDRLDSLRPRWIKFYNRFKDNPNYTNINSDCIKGILNELNDDYTKELLKE